MIKRILLLLIVLVLSTLMFIGGVFWQKSHPKYVFLENINELDNLDISEIYLNEINSINFNFRKTMSLATTKDMLWVLPVCEPQKIEQVIECLKNAEQLPSLNENTIGSIMLFKTRHRIYYMYIDWDNEKFYSQRWESKELMDLINQWKQETTKRITENRTKAEIEANADSFYLFRLSYPLPDGKPLRELSSQEENRWEQEVKAAYIKHIEQRRKEHAQRMETDETYRRIWTELVEQGVISSQIGTDVDADE